MKEKQVQHLWLRGRITRNNLQVPLQDSVFNFLWIILHAKLKVSYPKLYKLQTPPPKSEFALWQLLRDIENAWSHIDLCSVPLFLLLPGWPWRVYWRFGPSISSSIKKKIIETNFLELLHSLSSKLKLKQDEKIHWLVPIPE